MNTLLRTILLSISLMLLPHQTTLADEVDGFAGRDKASREAVESLEAYAVYKMGQYDEARIKWLSLASRNNPSAMINLANMAEQGQGVPRDLNKAAEWLRKAADWFLKAAEQGDSTAQFNLGVMLATNYGKGIKSASPEQLDAEEFLEMLKILPES